MERLAKLNIVVGKGEEWLPSRSSSRRVPGWSYKDKEKKNAEQRLQKGLE